MKIIADFIVQKEKVEECIVFSNQILSTVKYEDCNQTNVDKIQSDHVISKIGEWAVHGILVKKGYEISEPDMNIYLKNEKNWDSDLVCVCKKGEQIGQRIPLAVKSQSNSQSKKYGISWTFQNIQGGRRDPILDNPNDIVFFVTVSYEPNEMTYNGVSCSIYQPKRICQLIFGEPKIDKLKGKKKVVYECDN